ncbi:MAG TPA: hypothetical protein VGJ26_15885 [Pirellulales bacterium]
MLKISPDEDPEVIERVWHQEIPKGIIFVFLIWTACMVAYWYRHKKL